MVTTVCRGSLVSWHRGPQGVAPVRMPKADATEVAPKKSAANPSGGRRCPAGGASIHPCNNAKSYSPCSIPLAKSSGIKKPHFFGEPPERRPWANKMRTSPGCFLPGVPCCRSRPWGAGIPLVPIRSSILSHLGKCCPRQQVRIAGEILRNLRKKLVTMSGKKIATHYTLALRYYFTSIRL